MEFKWGSAGGVGKDKRLTLGSISRLKIKSIVWGAINETIAETTKIWVWVPLSSDFS